MLVLSTLWSLIFQLADYKKRKVKNTPSINKKLKKHTCITSSAHAAQTNYHLPAAYKNKQTHTKSRSLELKTMIKPYKHFLSRSRKKWPTVVASLMLVACLVVEIIQHWIFAYDLASRPSSSKRAWADMPSCQVYHHAKFVDNTLTMLSYQNTSLAFHSDLHAHANYNSLQ